MEKVFAPFTEEQIKIFNDLQDHGMMHQYTCCSPENIAECMRKNNSGSTFKENQGMLIATKEGLVCPCGKDKIQNWVYAGTFEIGTENI